MNTILERYGELLEEVDLWFAACRQKHADLINCRRGCSACCRGLFDITILDALYVRRGFDLLQPDVQHTLLLKAGARLATLTSRWPSFREPWILNHIPESEWEEMMPEDDEIPCLLLGEKDNCLIYEHRPMNCRLHGIPQFETSGEGLSDEWCTLNFTGSDPALIVDIRYPFNELFAQELLLFRELTCRLLGKALNELDTLIPAALLLDARTIKSLEIVPDKFAKGITP